MSDTKVSSRPQAAYESEQLFSEEVSLTRLVARRFFRHRMAVISLFILGLFVVFAFVGPFFYWWEPGLKPAEIPNAGPPSPEHPMGTIRGAADQMAMIMQGIQTSLKIAVVVAVCDVIFGSLWGAVSGYLGGVVDALMMRVVDVLLIIPFLIIAATVVTAFGVPRWYHIAFTIGVLGWVGTARLVRAEVLSLKQREFIEASQAMGSSTLRIVVKHLLPNVTGIILVSATLAIVVAILTEAALSFLGLGLNLPEVSLGMLVESGVDDMDKKPWLFFIPGLTLVVLLMTFNFIGDGLRDAFDPRQTIQRK
ncbi:ABC transporter permease [Salininema proteolyticum]|uniref:ABC transporter permease n=1 Tax=Salininema proteolyticum TaxID=1607685 RepID=A0ABV8TV99_9ACTN